MNQETQQPDSMASPRSGGGWTMSSVLLAARLLAAGALLLAGYFKMQGGPVAFMLSIESLEVVPEFLIAPSAYFLPWFEILLGLTLLLGVWTRESAILASGLFAVFTAALISVLARGMKVDCGCFGGMFGEAEVSLFTIGRNVVFLVASATAAVWGGGRFAIERVRSFSSG